jgi:hypothetical protein
MIFDRAYPDFLLRSTRQDRVCGFLKESRMEFDNATNLDRKSGGSPTIGFAGKNSLRLENRDKRESEITL